MIRRIGLDLDNTIVDYADLIREEIAALGVLDNVPGTDKRAARDALRSFPQGESLWIALQARIYGEAMQRAAAFPGAAEFIARARKSGIEITIVSHKTEFAAIDPEGRGTNLRDAARRWLSANGFIGPRGVDPEAVYFEPTRAAKTARIAALGLEAFIDDLVEVFADPGFPPGVQRWLFSSDVLLGESLADRVFPSWAAIAEAVFEEAVLEKEPWKPTRER